MEGGRALSALPEVAPLLSIEPWAGESQVDKVCLRGARNALTEQVRNAIYER